MFIIFFFFVFYVNKRYWICTKGCEADTISCPEGFCDSENKCSEGRNEIDYGEFFFFMCFLVVLLNVFASMYSSLFVFLFI